ncbi:MAG TPA: hypothetical protein PK584_02310 [Fervidobacterium sp.]|nr:hypothetical protein [Fervidobacterium sp.]
MWKRTSISVLLFLLLASFGFSFSFGGGGPFVYYFPGGTFIGGLKNLNLPIVDTTAFESGIIGFGGGGYSGFGHFYSGGFGFVGEKEYAVSSDKYIVTIGGGFGNGMRKLNFGNVTLSTSFGMGGVDIEIAKKVNENNVGLGNLENGTLEGYLGTSISYVALDAGVELSFSFVPMCELKVGANAIAGYSFDGWLVNGKTMTGIDQNQYRFLLTYNLYGGIAFGF